MTDEYVVPLIFQYPGDRYATWDCPEERIVMTGSPSLAKVIQGDLKKHTGRKPKIVPLKTMIDNPIVVLTSMTDDYYQGFLEPEKQKVSLRRM